MIAAPQTAWEVGSTIENMTSHAASLRSITAVLLVAVSACGSGKDGAAPPSSTGPSNVSEPSATEPAATETTTAETEIIDSVTAADVTLRDGVPTVKGTTYSIIDPTTKTGFAFMSSVDGAHPFLSPGLASLTVDEGGMEGLMTIASLDEARTFIQPMVDIMQIPGDAIEGLTEPVPADYLAWFAGLPGVTVGPIVETTVDGNPARSMTYAFGPTPNGLPCDTESLAGCLVALWIPSGAILVYPGDETGTLYEVVVDGRRAVIDVTNRPGAQAMFETVHFLNENEK